MNKIVTSQEEVLAGAKSLVATEGLEALNMRSLAQKLDIAVGSLYNYFPSKEVLVEASVGAVFSDIFQEAKPDGPSFVGYLKKIGVCLRKGEEKYPGFFKTHSLFFAKESQSEASLMKRESQGRLKKTLLAVLEADPGVHADFFKGVSKEDFVDVVFASLLYCDLEKKGDLTVLVATVEKALY